MSAMWKAGGRLGWDRGVDPPARYSSESGRSKSFLR